MRKFFIIIAALMTMYIVTGCSTVRILSSMIRNIGPSTVEIIEPKDSEKETFTTEHPFTIKVDKDADVSTFWVKLNGIDITNMFGSVTAGKTVTATPPYLITPKNNIIQAHASWKGKKKSFGSTMVTHKFNVMELTLVPVDNSNCLDPEDPSCYIIRVPMGESVEIRVELPEKPYGELDVTLKENVLNQRPIFAIGDQPPGESARVVIPSHLRYVVTTIKGIKIGSTHLEAFASACARGSIKIRVTE